MFCITPEQSILYKSNVKCDNHSVLNHGFAAIPEIIKNIDNFLATLFTLLAFNIRGVVLKVLPYKSWLKEFSCNI